MYFTNTPFLNSMEAIMKRPPGCVQRGGGRNRSPYKYTKKDCDCRLCLYYRKKNGCTENVCPVLDIRLSCGAASLSEAVKATFTEVKHIPLQRRLSRIYQRKDEEHMIFQNEQHKRIFEAQRLSLHKPSNQVLDELIGQAADGFGEGLEQREIHTEDGDLYVSFWNSGDDYFMENETNFRQRMSESPHFGNMQL